MSDEFMDIDGPEFLLSVNNEIANIRSVTYNTVFINTPDVFPGSLFDLSVYNEICVLDTNFLMSKLGYLDTVLTLADQRPGILLIVLPWVVIRELDGLKTSREVIPVPETEINLRARKAMRFIEHKLSEKCVSLRGQKMNEIYNPIMSQQKDIKGDDRILDCCMYFQNASGKSVSLLSNDRNLCIKVMVHEIESISQESLHKMEALLNRVAGLCVSQSKYATINTHKRRDSHKKKYIDNINHHMQQDQQQPSQQHQQDDGMQVDEDYPHSSQRQHYQQHYRSHQQHYSQSTEDDMMMDEDDDNVINNNIPVTTLGGSSDSKWAKEQPQAHRRHYHQDSPPAYLDNDPTLVAPSRPLRPNATISNHNRIPIHKRDSSWTYF